VRRVTSAVTDFEARSRELVCPFQGKGVGAMWSEGVALGYGWCSPLG